MKIKKQNLLYWLATDQRLIFFLFRKFYLACREAETENDDTAHEEPKALLDVGANNREKNCEEVIAEDGDLDGKEEDPADWLDQYLTEFDDIPTEVFEYFGL